MSFTEFVIPCEHFRQSRMVVEDFLVLFRGTNDSGIGIVYIEILFYFIYLSICILDRKLHISFSTFKLALC